MDMRIYSEKSIREDSPNKTKPISDDPLQFKHKTLEERAAEYGRKLDLSGELDWRGSPVGNEVW